MPELQHQFPPFSARTLECYLVGELDPEEAITIETAMATNFVLREHIADRRAAQAAFLQLHPVPDFLPDERRDQDHPRVRGLRRWGWLRLITASIAMVAAVLTLSILPGIGENQSPIFRARGELSYEVRIVIKRGGRVFDLADPRTLLRQGDAMRLEVESAGGGVLVVGLLSGGTGQLLMSQAVGKGRWSQPSSFILDDAQGEETLVVYLADDDVEAQAMASEISKGHIPPGVRRFTWEKEPLR